MRTLVPHFILDRFARGEASGRLDAATLFLDMSGFTATTEALLPYGKQGSEVLAQIMLAVFDPLVGAVYEQGGFVANFGGDGFTAVFQVHGGPGQGGTEGKEDVATSNTVHPPVDSEPVKVGLGDGGTISILQPSLRAVAAAWRISQHLAQHPEHVTPYGVFNFAVKASVGRGPVAWQIWQGSVPAGQSAAFYFCGPAIEECMAGEEWARSGDVVVSRSAYEEMASTQPDLESANPVSESGDFWKIQRPSEDLAPPLEVRPVRPAGSHPFFAPQLQTLSTLGEFRHVLALFLQLRSMPSAAFLDGFFRLLEQYGGYLCRVDHVAGRQESPRLLLFWGAPTSYENDVERTLNFLLDLRSLSGPALRAGISTQMAYSGFVGSPLREEYTCYGSRVNLAARMMAQAEWGEIWLDSRLAERAERGYQLSFVDELPFKGFAEPQAVYALRGRESSPADRLYRGRMIGREKEIALLEAAAAPLFEGRFGGLVHVVGDAGIGKSRLIHEFLETSEVFRLGEVFVCRTDEILREPLNPFRYFLRNYFDQISSASEEANKRHFDQILDALITDTLRADLAVELERTRPFLGALIDLRWPGSLYEQLDPRLRRENTLAGLKALVRAESLRQPLLIHLEDAHWLDEESGRFLPELSRNAAGYPFLIIATARPPEAGLVDVSQFVPPDVPYLSISLEALSSMEVESLMADHLGGPAAPGLARLVQDRAEGNPFFAEQILLFLQEQALLKRTFHGWQLREKTLSDAVLPTDVRAVLLARLDCLTQPVREVVQTASVLGREFDVRVLSQMRPEDPALMAKVRTAEGSAIWLAQNELRYIFKHALLRDAAYEMQMPSHLRRLHWLAAEAIRNIFSGDLSPHYPDLAYHFRLAERTDEEREYSKLAGEQAAANYANAEAVTYFSRALELTPDSEFLERFEVLLARERVYELLGERESQARDLAVLDDLAQQIDDGLEQMAARQAQVAYGQTKLLEVTGDYPAAVEAAARTVTLARRGKSVELEAYGHVRWAVALWRQGQYDAAREQALKIKELSGSGELGEIEGNALVQLGNVSWFKGSYEQAAAYYEEALVIFRQIGHLRGQAATLQNLGLVNMNQGNYDRAMPFVQQGLALYRQMGSRTNVAQALSQLGNASRQLREFSAAAEYLKAALPITRDLGDRNTESIVLSSLGDTLRDQGEYEEAAQYHRESLQIAHDIGNRRSQSLEQAKGGILLYQQGELASARADLEEAAALGEELGLKNVKAFPLTFLGHVLVRLGALEEAADAYQEALQIRRELGERNLATEVLAGLAQLALAQEERDQAAAYVEQILDYLKSDTLAGAEEPVAIYLTCYRVLRALGDPRAAAVLRAGAEYMDRRAATIDSEAQKRLYYENVAAHRQMVEESKKVAPPMVEE